jgi:hypothetical protein
VLIQHLVLYHKTKMVYTRSRSQDSTDNYNPDNNNMTTAIDNTARLAAEAEAARVAAAAAVATVAAAVPTTGAGAATGGGAVVIPPNPMTLGSNLTDLEVITFFKGKDNMNCVSDAAVLALNDEGITIPEDLIDFEDDDIDNMARNLGKIPTPNTIRLSAICVKRLKIAAACARFYKSIGRDLSKSNMSYNVMSIFWKQWQALESQKEEQG